MDEVIIILKIRTLKSLSEEVRTAVRMAAEDFIVQGENVSLEGIETVPA